MKYTSTRLKMSINSAQAICRGLSDDGGLFVPEEFPIISDMLMKKLIDLDYRGRAFEILRMYLTDFSDDEVRECVDSAYLGTFDNDNPAPLKEIRQGMNMLELWHGPTCAFKDMALQLLPFLLTKSAKKVNDGKKTIILVATSGDTGKAALEGFANVENTSIIVFYPRDGVSPMQKLQMMTQQGDNVSVCAIKGNFDDAQSAVKAIFADEEMKQYLADRNMSFSSANSINFGRLVPQIVYYVSAYCDLVKSGKINIGEHINVVVPTGNFGNILAAYYAKRMGVPIAKFICASNKNNILTDFINTGAYDKNREFYATISPSMDILISSNLERLLFELADRDTGTVSRLMQSLAESGIYNIDDAMLTQLKTEFVGCYCDEAQTVGAIGRLFEQYGYLCDTHTAVAVDAYEKYLQDTDDKTTTVIVSTASPYKFASSVLPAVYGEAVPTNDFDKVELLSAVTGTKAPAPLASLKEKQVLHKECVDKRQMKEFIKEKLN